MEKTRVISVRLPESLIQRLDEIAEGHYYWKRNAIIEKSLQAVAYATDYPDFQRILEWWRPSGKSMVLTFHEKCDVDPADEK